MAKFSGSIAHKRALVFGSLLVSAIVIGVVLNFWMAPQHSHTVGLLSYDVEPGYTWQNPRAFGPFRHAAWAPGIRHPRLMHISAEAVEGRWAPDDGYSLTYDDHQKPVRVSWRPGRTHSRVQHIISSSRERYWHTDTGYAFYARSSPSTAPVTETLDVGQLERSYEVRWRPGSRHPTMPHISASDQEGYWRPDSGYHFVTTGNLLVEPDGPADYANALDQAVASDARGWRMNRYLPGSMRVTEVVNDQYVQPGHSLPGGSPNTPFTLVHGAYSYSSSFFGRAQGAVWAAIVNGRVVAVEYFDYVGTVRDPWTGRIIESDSTLDPHYRANRAPSSQETFSEYSNRLRDEQNFQYEQSRH